MKRAEKMEPRSPAGAGAGGGSKANEESGLPAVGLAKAGQDKPGWERSKRKPRALAGLKREHPDLPTSSFKIVLRAEAGGSGRRFG